MPPRKTISSRGSEASRDNAPSMSRPYPRLGEERGHGTGLGLPNLLFGH